MESKIVPEESKHAEPQPQDDLDHDDSDQEDPSLLVKTFQKLGIADELPPKSNETVKRIIMFGMIGAGKSTVANAAIGANVFDTGT